MVDNGNPEAGSKRPTVKSSSDSDLAQNAVIQNNPAEQPRVRDKWDKTEILLRPAAAFLAAITVALIGWYGQQVFKMESDAVTERAGKAQVEETERARIAEEEITRRNELSQNYRLYTELLSKREEAESALRRDIFSSILKEFLKISGVEEGHTGIRNRLLKLEILALNFGEALSLSPLFIELDKNIRNTVYETDFAKLDKADDKKRLEGLAKRVSQQQLAALSTGGISWDFAIPIKKVSKGNSFNWPQAEDYEQNLQDVTRSYSFRFSDANESYHSVRVALNIQVVGELETIEREFGLNFFNFPMVDNTRLSNDQRFALIMTDFGDKYIHFSAIVFPGKYSSQRDKPFLDDVIHRLQSETLKKTTK